MGNSCKIAEAGLIDMLNDIKNPLTTIRLSMELLESGDESLKQQCFEIIKKSTDLIETSVREISESFKNQDFNVHYNAKDELILTGITEI